MLNQLSTESYFNESLLKPSMHQLKSIEEENDEETAAMDRTFTKNNPHKLYSVIPKERLHQAVPNKSPFKRQRIVKSQR